MNTTPLPIFYDDGALLELYRTTLGFLPTSPAQPRYVASRDRDGCLVDGWCGRMYLQGQGWRVCDLVADELWYPGTQVGEIRELAQGILENPLPRAPRIPTPVMVWSRKREVWVLAWRGPYPPRAEQEG